MPYSDPDKQRDAQRVSLTAKRAERRAAGLCPQCGLRPPVKGRTKCEVCRKRHTQSRKSGKKRKPKRVEMKIVPQPPPNTITLDEAAARSNMSRSNLDYHRRKGHVKGKLTELPTARGSKQLWISEDFTIDIPVVTRTPPTPSKPGMITFREAAKRAGVDPRTFRRRYHAGLVKGEVERVQHSGADWFFITADFTTEKPRPKLKPRAAPKPKAKPLPRMPVAQQPSFPDRAACAICGRRNVAHATARKQLADHPDPPHWPHLDTKRPVPGYWPRCGKCADRIKSHIAGLRAARAAVDSAYDDGLLEETEAAAAESPVEGTA